MRPASVGPVKALLRKINLAEARAVIDQARAAGEESARPMLMDWLATQDAAWLIVRRKIVAHARHS